MRLSTRDPGGPRCTSPRKSFRRPHWEACGARLLERQHCARVPAGVARATAAHGQLPAAHLERKQTENLHAGHVL